MTLLIIFVVAYFLNESIYAAKGMTSPRQYRKNLRAELAASNTQPAQYGWGDYFRDLNADAAASARRHRERSAQEKAAGIRPTVGERAKRLGRLLIEPVGERKPGDRPGGTVTFQTADPNDERRRVDPLDLAGREERPDPWAHSTPVTRRPDREPETAADRRFFDLRESGYTGPLDQDSEPVVDVDEWIAAQQREGEHGRHVGTAPSRGGQMSDDEYRRHAALENETHEQYLARRASERRDRDQRDRDRRDMYAGQAAAADRVADRHAGGPGGNSNGGGSTVASGTVEVNNNETARLAFAAGVVAAGQLQEAVSLAEQARGRLASSARELADAVSAGFDRGAIQAAQEGADVVSLGTLAEWSEKADAAEQAMQAGVRALDKYRDAEDLVASNGVDGRTLNAS